MPDLSHSQSLSLHSSPSLSPVHDRHHSRSSNAADWSPTSAGPRVLADVAAMHTPAPSLQSPRSTIVGTSPFGAEARQQLTDVLALPWVAALIADGESDKASESGSEYSDDSLYHLWQSCDGIVDVLMFALARIQRRNQIVTSIEELSEAVTKSRSNRRLPSLTALPITGPCAMTRSTSEHGDGTGQRSRRADSESEPRSPGVAPINTNVGTVSGDIVLSPVSPTLMKLPAVRGSLIATINTDSGLSSLSSSSGMLPLLPSPPLRARASSQQDYNTNPNAGSNFSIVRSHERSASVTHENPTILASLSGASHRLKNPRPTNHRPSLAAIPSMSEEEKTSEEKLDSSTINAAGITISGIHTTNDTGHGNDEIQAVLEMLQSPAVAQLYGHGSPLPTLSYSSVESLCHQRYLSPSLVLATLKPIANHKRKMFRDFTALVDHLALKCHRIVLLNELRCCQLFTSNSTKIEINNTSLDLLIRFGVRQTVRIIRELDDRAVKIVGGIEQLVAAVQAQLHDEGTQST